MKGFPDGIRLTGGAFKPQIDDVVGYKASVKYKVPEKTVSTTSDITDEAFVRFDLTKVRSSISDSGIQTQYFADEKIWFTKYKYVKDITDPTNLETILYNKSIQPFTKGKFS